MESQSKFVEAAKLAFRIKGSVLYDSIPIAGFSACVSLFATLLRKNMIFFMGTWWSAAIEHPLAVQVFGVLVSLLLTNRTTAAINRWWTSMNAVAQMLHKWHDAESFILSGLKKDMRVLSMQLQRSDMDDETRTWAESQLMRMRSLRETLIHWFSLLNAVALGTFKYGESKSLSNIHCKYPFFDWISKDEKKSEKQCRMEKIRKKMSQGSGAQAFEDATAKGLHYIGELSEMESVQLHQIEDKVALVGQWLTEGLILADWEGLLTLPQTLAAQAHTRIAEGLQAYDEAYTLAAIPYPFPIAQVTNMLMLFLAMMMPIMIEKFTQAWILTPLMSFMMTLAFWSLNKVALELEKPFGDGVNDLPMKELCDIYLDRMMDVAKTSFVDQSGFSSVHVYSQMFSSDEPDVRSSSKESRRSSKERSSSKESSSPVRSSSKEGAETVAEKKQSSAPTAGFSLGDTKGPEIINVDSTDVETGFSDPDIIDIEACQYNLGIFPQPVVMQPQRPQHMYHGDQLRLYPEFLRPAQAPIFRKVRPPQHQWLIDRAAAKSKPKAAGSASPTADNTRSTALSKSDGQMMEETTGSEGRPPMPPGRQRPLSTQGFDRLPPGRVRRPGSAPPTRSIFGHPRTAAGIPEYGYFIDTPDCFPMDIMPLVAQPSQTPCPPFNAAMPIPQYPCGVVRDSDEGNILT